MRNKHKRVVESQALEALAPADSFAPSQARSVAKRLGVATPGQPRVGGNPHLDFARYMSV